jgi:hypothetical protein|eukprot:SAG25_NODE_194_length_12183_cov_70.943893_20_plen_58_part_00
MQLHRLPRNVAHTHLIYALLLVENTSEIENLGVAKDDESAESDDGDDDHDDSDSDSD